MEQDKNQFLFDQIAQRNQDAFNKLFREYYTPLVRFAIGYVHDSQSAEGIVQDVFIKLWENSRDINIEISVLAYLYKMVRNSCLNIIKHETVKRKYEQEQLKVTDAVEKNSETDLDLRFFKKMLSKAVANLPEKCRHIFEMAKFEGLSYDEIADYLKVSPKTIENQMGIALKKLREAMLPHIKNIYEW